MNTEYGKFNSAEELLKGYAELEKSFTQKCQQLSELQKQMTANSQEKSQETPQVVQDENPQLVLQNNPVGTSGQPSPNSVTSSTADDKASTVPTPNSADSLTDGSQNVTLPPRVMTGGGNVSMALPNRPKTLKEASELAKKYFS